MTRADVLNRLSHHTVALKQRGVKSLAFFGSAARDEARADSDVDILVEFEQPGKFAQYMDLKFYLETVLNCKVDLVTSKALKPRVRSEVEKEAIYVPGL